MTKIIMVNKNGMKVPEEYTISDKIQTRINDSQIETQIEFDDLGIVHAIQLVKNNNAEFAYIYTIKYKDKTNIENSVVIINGEIIYDGAIYHHARYIYPVFI